MINTVRHSLYFFTLFVGLALSSSCTTRASIASYDAPFIPHMEPRPFGSYLSRNVHYPPVRAKLEGLEARLGRSLKNRGEAHITVITPPEYDRALKSHISIERIHEIARNQDIQRTDFQVVCMGRGRKDADETYFLVVTAPALLEIRRHVHREFIAAGGSPADFDPENFYPHITLGFTNKDLHQEDGVIKNELSCRW